MFGKNSITLCVEDMCKVVRAGLEKVDLFQYKVAVKVTKVTEDMECETGMFVIDFEGVSEEDAQDNDN